MITDRIGLHSVLLPVLINVVAREIQVTSQTLALDKAKNKQIQIIKQKN